MLTHLKDATIVSDPIYSGLFEVMLNRNIEHKSIDRELIDNISAYAIDGNKLTVTVNVNEHTLAKFIDEAKLVTGVLIRIHNKTDDTVALINFDDIMYASFGICQDYEDVYGIMRLKLFYSTHGIKVTS